MNSTRQVLRWSLPGLILVLNALVVHGLWIGLIERQSPWTFINEATAPALVAVLAGGLPAGFLVYQIYYHTYRPVGRLLLGLGGPPIFLRRDRGGAMIRMYRDNFDGRDELLALVEGARSNVEKFEDRAEDPRLKAHFKLWVWPETHLQSKLEPHHSGMNPRGCRTCVSIYEQRWDENWLLIQSMIDYCSRNESGRWIKAEYTSGSDLYHALGASRTAVWLGVVGTLIYDGGVRFLMGFDPTEFQKVSVLPSLGLAVFVVALTALETFVLTKCRVQLETSYERRVAAGAALVAREMYP
jgi:hypothetical protein